MQCGDCYLLLPYNGICLGKVRAFKVTQSNDSSKRSWKKKAQKATKPAFGLGNVSGSPPMRCGAVADNFTLLKLK